MSPAARMIPISSELLRMIILQNPRTGMEASVEKRIPCQIYDLCTLMLKFRSHLRKALLVQFGPGGERMPTHSARPKGETRLERKEKWFRNEPIFAVVILIATIVAGA